MYAACTTALNPHTASTASNVQPSSPAQLCLHRYAAHAPSSFIHTNSPFVSFRFLQRASCVVLR